MAIIVKEEKKGLSIMTVVLIGGLIALVGAAVYYVFFSPTPLVEGIPPPEGYEDVAKISKLKIDAEGIVKSPIWQSLEIDQSIPSLDVIITGRRTNPFEPTDGSQKISR